LKTTVDNEAQHRKNIDIAKFPTTIRDAIGVCRDIGIGYLWVDALCILQNSAEWSIEASNMGKIYGLSAFTLAISSSTNSNEGFLQKRDAEAFDTESVGKATIAQTGIQIPHKSLESIKNTCPLDSRGWAFQEERLSPRIMHWTAHGIFWTCLSGTCAETKAEFLPHERGHETSRFQNFQQAEFDVLGNGQSRAIQIDYAWLKLIEDYSTRDFTFRYDRLPALSGVVGKYFAEISKTEDEEKYVAGLWLHSLYKGLLWTVREGTRGASDKMISWFDVASSWSWASIPPEKGIRYSSRFGRSACRILSHEIQLASKDQFGAILSAKICLKARLRPLVHLERKIEWPNNESKDETGHPSFADTEGSVYAFDQEGGRVLLSHDVRTPIVIHLDYEIPSDLTSCYCFEVNRKGLLLLKKLEGHNEYERIGCAPWHEGNTIFDLWPAVEVNLI
jgi:Heterokaryon incompatibility protein (HET)